MDAGIRTLILIVAFQKDAVADTNNASDGDLFYAWGPITMAAQGGYAALAARAKAIATDLATKCIVAHPYGSGRVLLAPAAEGFERDGAVTINFSYYVPLAMRELAKAMGVKILATCATDGEAVMAELAATGLMPDWIAIGPLGPTTVPDVRS